MVERGIDAGSLIGSYCGAEAWAETVFLLAVSQSFSASTSFRMRLLLPIACVED